MSKCTAAQAVSAFAYWLGYLEKASAEYASSRNKECFRKNPGSNNYTYAGHLCGVQGQPWCAAQVSTAIYDACDNARDAKSVLWGVWPYVRCDQLYDAAPEYAKGRRGSWGPISGDVIVFGRASRDHTGMVYAADSNYVYTYEGNSSNKCQKRCYRKTDDWIWGYVRPDYADGENLNIPGEKYGVAISYDPVLHLLSKGCAGPEVSTVQRLCFAMGIASTDGGSLEIDGIFGPDTKAAVISAQKFFGIDPDGEVGKFTWTKFLKG